MFSLVIINAPASETVKAKWITKIIFEIKSTEYRGGGKIEKKKIQNKQIILK